MDLFRGSILLLTGNIAGLFHVPAAIPVAMMLLILGTFISAAIKKEAG